ncbi:WD40 repeat-like protein [Phytophthora palmivora]|uniref:WD40 repeat-like protein n=1 Tax=Phytophthora palmivora TaxID=4796 RepID=A0A2P4Y3E0_9STRA|nr:WD40 repeat-like protein [Phytophthora palmivora]
MEASVTSFAVLGKEIKELFIGTEAGKLYSTKIDQQKNKPGASDDSSNMDVDKKNRNSLLGSSAGGIVREVVVEAVSKDGSHFGPVTAMHFNPLLPMHRDSLLLTCSLDSTVKLWSLEHPDTPVLSFEPSSEYISDVRWSSVHPALFAVADSNGTVSVWNILRDVEVPVVSAKISQKSLNKVRWSADGKSVITGDADGKSYIYEVPSDVALPQPDDLSLLEGKTSFRILRWKGNVMSKKQDTLWTAFGRQRQPPAKRQKVQTLEENEVSVSRRKQRDHLEDVDAGTLTDADLLSSQEDAQSAETQSVCDGDALPLERRRESIVTVETIKDSVHGLMTFEPVCMRIIDTLQVQLPQ